MTKITPAPNLVDLPIGAKVEIMPDPSHKQWKEIPAAILEKMFPTTETLLETRIGPGARKLGRFTNGFEYVLDDGWQYNSALTYIIEVC